MVQRETKLFPSHRLEKMIPKVTLSTSVALLPEPARLARGMMSGVLQTHWSDLINRFAEGQGFSRAAKPTKPLRAPSFSSLLGGPSQIRRFHYFLAKQMYHLAVERRNVIGLAARYQAFIADHFPVDPDRAGVLEIRLQ